MTDWSVIFIKDWFVSIIVSLKLSPLNMNVLLTALLVATAGGILQIGGASWDVTSHILRQPETFFTPSHTVLYTGAGLTTIAAIIGVFISLKNNEEIRSRSFYAAFKLLIIGAAIQLISGPGVAFGIRCGWSDEPPTLGACHRYIDQCYCCCSWACKDLATYTI
jgi:hypothetical protein